MVTSVEADASQLYENTPTINGGWIFRNASLCGIPVAKYDTTDVVAVESINAFWNQPFPKNVVAQPSCVEE